ncbi:hypothetical protein A2U01_0059452, partial [Trifolium medium]|nr:hypothetical protein [Trifolium medium]
MGVRMTMKEGVTVQQSLIKWKGKSVDDVTWEDNEVLRSQFPEFGLEDKTVFMEGGIDRSVNQSVGLDPQPNP